MTTSPIKVGFVGYGFSTSCFHLPFVLPNPDLEVYAFLFRHEVPGPGDKPLPWGHCTDHFPKAKHYLNAEGFYADQDIELVIISAHGHYGLVKQALQAGKHVVVEKPFVDTTAQADELIALAKEKNKILTVFHNRRFDSDFRTVSHLIKTGALGDVVEADIHFDFPNPSWIQNWDKEKWEPGQGMAYGLGTHTLDQALVLFGKPKSVTAFLRSNRGLINSKLGSGFRSQVDDTFTIVLQYDNNLLVTVKTAVISNMKDQLRFFVRGTGGTFIKFGNCPQEANAIDNPRKPAVDLAFGRENEEIWGTLATNEPFQDKNAPEAIEQVFENVQAVEKTQAFEQQFDETSKKYVGKYPSKIGYYRGYYENVSKAIIDLKSRQGNVSEDLFDKYHLVKPETARDGLRIIELAHQSQEEGKTCTF